MAKQQKRFGILIGIGALISVMLSATLLTQAACTPSATSGDDTIDCTGFTLGVNGGAGDDDITNNGIIGAMSGGAGDDDIINNITAGVMSGNAGEDYLENNGTAASMNGNAGNDTLDNYGTVIGNMSGGDGDDNINNEGIAGAMLGGNGDDCIYNAGTTALISGGAGDDCITNDGSALVILGGEGSDIIENYGTALNVGGGDDDDYLYNDGTILNDFEGGDGNDVMRNDGFIAGTMNGDEGDDAIYNFGEADEIDGGEGDDDILNNGIVYGDIYGYDGDDVIVLAVDGLVEGGVYGEEGDDIFYLEGGEIVGLLDGGNGFDTLYFYQVVASCTEYEATTNVISQNNSSGSVTINTLVYSWIDFELLINSLTGSACTIERVALIPNDGRINFEHIAFAAVAVYCMSDGGINVIGTRGENSFHLSPEAIAQFQNQAIATQNNMNMVLKGGNGFIARADGSLEVISSNPNNPADPYNFVFDWHSKCGEQLSAK